MSEYLGFKGSSGGGSAAIDDASTSTTKTWSSNKINSVVSSVNGGYFKSFDTLAALQATTGMTTGQVAKVMNDSVATNNGDYRYTGSAWVKGYDSLTDAKAYTDSKVAALRVQSTKNLYGGETSWVLDAPWVGYTKSYYTDITVSEGQKIVLSNNVDKKPDNFAFLDSTGTKLTATANFNAIKSNLNGGAFAYTLTSGQNQIAAPANSTKLRIVWHTANFNFDRSMFQLEVIPAGDIVKAGVYDPPQKFADYLTKYEFIDKKQNVASMQEVVTNPNNYYDPYNIVGAYLDSAANLSNLIPTVEGDKWYMQRPATAASAWFYFFDSNKVKISQVLYPYATAPANAAYVAGVLSNTTTDSAAIQAFNTSPTAPVQIEKGLYPTAIFPRYQLYQVAYKNDILEFNNLKGKHLYAFGDSITLAAAWLGSCDMLGMTYKNFAISGGQWTVDNNIATQIDNMVTWVNQGNRLPDIIGIALGTNDWGNNRPIGNLQAVMAMTETDSDVVNHATVLAAIKYAIIRLRALTPNAFIFLITPLQRHNLYTYDYVQAVIDGGKMMSVPVMRAYDESGLNAFDPTNKTKWFTDGLHTTAAGNKKYSGYVAKKLCQIYAVDQA